MNRRDVIKGGAAIAAAAALPSGKVQICTLPPELEEGSHLGDFLEPGSYFSVPRPPCEQLQLPRELFIFLGKDPPGGVA
jgi:hypothetical protein